MEVQECCEINRTFDEGEPGVVRGKLIPKSALIVAEFVRFRIDIGSRIREISESTTNGPNSQEFGDWLAGPCGTADLSPNTISAPTSINAAANQYGNAIPIPCSISPARGPRMRASDDML